MKNTQKDDAGLEKLKKAIEALEHSLTYEEKVKKDNFYFSGISKSYEVCLEYAWKYFKRRGTEEGVEIYSPKEAIKIAGRMGLIDNVEKWQCMIILEYQMKIIWKLFIIF